MLQICRLSVDRKLVLSNLNNKLNLAALLDNQDQLECVHDWIELIYIHIYFIFRKGP